MGQVQHSIAEDHQRLFVFAAEVPRQWMILHLLDQPISDPLPELGLSSPEPAAVPTNNERGAFLLFLILFATHLGLFAARTPSASSASTRDQRLVASNQTVPRREAS